MTQKKASTAEQVRDKAEEVAAFLSDIVPAGPIEQRYLESAKRDIAGGFHWAERAATGESQG